MLDKTLQKWCANKCNFPDYEDIHTISFEVVDIGSWEEINVCGLSFFYKTGREVTFHEVRLNELTPINFIKELMELGELTCQ